MLLLLLLLLLLLAGLLLAGLQMLLRRGSCCVRLSGVVVCDCCCVARCSRHALVALCACATSFCAVVMHAPTAAGIMRLQLVWRMHACMLHACLWPITT